VYEPKVGADSSSSLTFIVSSAPNSSVSVFSELEALFGSFAVDGMARRGVKVPPDRNEGHRERSSGREEVGCMCERIVAACEKERRSS
jgi:hypothetical protein